MNLGRTRARSHCCGSVCHDVASLPVSASASALALALAPIQVVRRPFYIPRPHDLSDAIFMQGLYLRQQTCDRGTQLAQVSINNNRYCWRPIHLMTDKPTNIYYMHTAIMLHSSLSTRKHILTFLKLFSQINRQMQHHALFTTTISTLPTNPTWK